jgi:hypothetical protein
VSGSSNIISTGNSRLSLLPECRFSGPSRVTSQGNLFPAPKKLLLRVEQIPCYNKKLSEPIYDRGESEKGSVSSERVTWERPDQNAAKRQHDTGNFNVRRRAIRSHPTTQTIKQDDMGIFVSVDRL